jgi:hypothetical protein
MTSIYQTPIAGGSIQIPENNVFCPQSVATEATLFFEEGDFRVLVAGTFYKINRYDVRGFPTVLKVEQLSEFLQNGYLSIEKIGTDYALTAHLRLLGGTHSEDIIKAQREFNRRIDQLRKSPAIRQRGGIGGEIWKDNYDRIRNEVCKKYGLSHPCLHGHCRHF